MQKKVLIDNIVLQGLTEKGQEKVIAKGVGTQCLFSSLSTRKRWVVKRRRDLWGHRVGESGAGAQVSEEAEGEAGAPVQRTPKTKAESWGFIRKVLGSHHGNKEKARSSFHNCGWSLGLFVIWRAPREPVLGPQGGRALLGLLRPSQLCFLHLRTLGVAADEYLHPESSNSRGEMFALGRNVRGLYKSYLTKHHTPQHVGQVFWASFSVFIRSIISGNGVYFTTHGLK